MAQLSPKASRLSRQASAVLAIVIALTFVGFFVGVRQAQHLQEHRSFADGAAASTAPAARSNAELVTHPWSNRLTAWTPKAIQSTEPVTPEDRGAKQAALMHRAANRAFPGAPPTIPHPISARSSGLECKACHLSGAAIGAVVAPAMSHQPFVSCAQCHVPQAPDLPNRANDGSVADRGRGQLRLAAATVANRFIALHSAVAPYRANRVSPPQIPHATFMREQCQSCHGVSGCARLAELPP